MKLKKQIKQIKELGLLIDKIVSVALMDNCLKRRKRLALSLLNSRDEQQRKDLQYLFDWNESTIQKLLLPI